jgi:hypothetical protein
VPFVERIAAKYAVMHEAVGVVNVALSRPEIRMRLRLPDGSEVGTPPDADPLLAQGNDRGRGGSLITSEMVKSQVTHQRK